MAAKLETITHDGPVVARELGTGRDGIVWTVAPANFPALVAMVNANGGPGAWSITPA